MNVNPDDVKIWTVVQVEEYLKLKGFGESITNILRGKHTLHCCSLAESSMLTLFFFLGNEIDGESLLLLNDVDVASMGFKIGPVAKFRSFLDALKVKVAQNLSKQSEKQKQSASVANENESSSESIDMHLPQENQKVCKKD